MLNGALARRYAGALFELAVEMSALDQIDNELRDISDLITNNSELKYLLNHPNIEDRVKKETLGKIVGSNSSEIAKHFLYLLIDRRRQNLIALVQREFTRLANEARDIVEAKVISATPLTPSQEEKLRQVITQGTGKKVQLKALVDSNLIGGAKLQIGDRVMDGSISSALYKIREELRKTSEKPQTEIGVS